MELQNRDREILKLCYEQNFLLTEHVVDFFVGNYKYYEAARRIRELKEAGYLRVEKHPDSKRTQLIRLDKDGEHIAKEFSQITLGKIAKNQQEFLTHDAFVTSTRLFLQKVWDGNWIPEKAIRGLETGEVPDGLILFANGRKAAIEIENSVKGKSRFLNRLEMWRSINVVVVLFVTTKEDVYHYVQTFLKEGPTKPVFGLVRFEDFKKPNPEIWSRLGSLDLFSKRSL